ncbi:MAG: metallophosphoesterase [Nanoarchaeota archaeon]|nr:metallophosphoesterase [Nanoarchaeota archaeon]
MKILVVGDLHGQKPKIHFKDFDAIIAPGDFCSDAPREYIFRALREHLENPDSEVKWYDYIGRRKATEMLKTSIRDGRRILEFLDSFGVPVYAVPGNWEPMGSRKRSELAFARVNRWKDMLNGLENVVDVHYKRRTINRDFDVVGYGVVSGPEYPQYKEDLKRYDKRELKSLKTKFNRTKKRLSKLFVKAKRPVIFMPHNVPFNTSLDKITNKESPKYGYHYGSVLAREMIERYQPLLCIGGHMHEHFGRDKIGKTVCINAGFGKKVNTLIDLDENKGKIRSIKFHPRIYG